MLICLKSLYANPFENNQYPAFVKDFEKNKDNDIQANRWEKDTLEKSLVIIFIHNS